MNMQNTLYDSFNARYLTFEEVAASFITNDDYHELLKNNSTLLMGPRGCGKTTLLKMLTPRALFSWESEEAKNIRQKIPFIGVYIPSDIQWKKQLIKFNSKFQSQPDFRDIITKQLVNTNILLSFLGSFTEIAKIAGSMSNPYVTEFCKTLIEEWTIKKPIAPNFFSISSALRNRLKEVNVLINKFATFHNEEKISDGIPDYYYYEYMDLIDAACTAFEHFFEKVIDNIPIKRWALCFDELEIAPGWLQRECIENLRSRSQRFIFKLTTSPLISLYDELKRDAVVKSEDLIGGRQDEDYKIIRSWVYNKRGAKNWDRFAVEIIKTMLLRRVGEKLNPTQVFGDYKSEMPFVLANPTKFKNALNKKNNEQGSVLWIMLKELAQQDASLHDFLLKNNINPLNPVTVEKSKEDSILRKIKPILEYRYYLRKNDKMRSRKTVSLHFGLPYIYELCDGNPRMLINLIEYMIPRIKYNEHSRTLKIDIQAQSRAIEEFSVNYLKRISNHPDANIILNGIVYNLGKIIETIGDYFYKRLIKEKFSIDPVGSFEIDNRIPFELTKLLRLGLNLGALHYLDPVEAFTDENLSKKKFRLAYILYPYFKIPKREYQKIQLNKIILDVNNKPLDQLTFFNDNETN